MLKAHPIKTMLLLVVLGAIITACSAPKSIEEACINSSELPPFDRIAVEGYLLIEWCNEANDGQIMCMVHIKGEGGSLRAVVRTDTKKAWPTGIYPPPSEARLHELICGRDETCSSGEGQTHFQVRGECNPLLASSLGLQRVLYVNFDGISPGTSGANSALWLGLLAAGIILIIIVAVLYARKARKKGTTGRTSSEEPGQFEEERILDLILRGLSNEKIAKSLNLPESAVARIKVNLYHKFGVNRDEDLIYEVQKEKKVNKSNGA